MKIILDMDDVLCHFVDSWLCFYNTMTGKCGKKCDIKSWDVRPYIGDDIYEYLVYAEVYSEAKPNVDAQKYTRKWLSEGHQIVVATRALNYIAAAEKIKWVQEHFPHLADKLHIVTGDTKHWLGGDIMVDDAFHNLLFFDGHRIVMNQPWNESSDLLHEYKYYRAFSFADIDTFIKEHARKD